jgi:hypothetical protein
VGTDYEHQRANHYLTQQHRNSNNFSITTKIIIPARSSTNCSLWKATKKMKQVKKASPPLRTLQGTWARSNVEKAAHAFAEHLTKVFQMYPSENEP